MRTSPARQAGCLALVCHTHCGVDNRIAARLYHYPGE
jgi:hypothetical protein